MIAEALLVDDSRSALGLLKDLIEANGIRIEKPRESREEFVTWRKGCQEVAQVQVRMAVLEDDRNARNPDGVIVKKRGDAILNHAVLRP
jgi:hypothetical protein